MTRHAFLLAVLIAVGILVGCPQKPPTADAPTITSEGGAPKDKPAGFSAGVTQVDDLAPDFTLKDTDGNPVAKADFSGQILVLDFWATYCDPCKKKLKEYEPVLDKYRDQGVELVAVSLDSVPAVAAGWAKEEKCPFRIVMFDDAFKAAYFPEVPGELPIPQVRILDRDGNLRFKFDSRSEVSDLDLALKQLVGEKVGGDQAVSNEVAEENASQ